MNEEKFKGKYRIASARLQSWDYASNGMYFITICTGERHHFFGEITQGKMVLSHVGIIADILWYEIKNHAKNIELGEFVVMPNHVHGILILNNSNDSGRECDSFSAKLEENPYKLRLLENIQMITNPSMKVKILPSKLKSDSLSVHAEYARNHTERSWKQGVTRPQLQGTLTLMGSSQGKTEPKKATHWEEDAILSLTTSEKIPPKCSLANGMSKGFRQLKWLCLKEHNNRWIGTNRNEFGVYK